MRINCGRRTMADLDVGLALLHALALLPQILVDLLGHALCLCLALETHGAL